MGRTIQRDGNDREIPQPQFPQPQRLCGESNRHRKLEVKFDKLIYAVDMCRDIFESPYEFHYEYMIYRDKIMYTGQFHLPYAYETMKR